jgi:selenide,water dikinase
VIPHPDVLVGFETADDAGVFRIDQERALVQTVDIFTPVVDDPKAYGAIAAANALSDVYAMGGKPLTALAIACFPEKGMDIEILTQMMLGGLAKLKEANVALIGGHTVADQEIKFGYSVTGMVHPEQVYTNAAARPGDRLVLTKPLGIGIITSGIKFRKASEQAAARAIEVMSALNDSASAALARHDCHAVTDVTGFGLLGHALEIAEASGVTIRIESGKVPYIDEALPLAEARIIPGAVAKTWKLIAPKTKVGAMVTEPIRNILTDPQTSGGLLISVTADETQSLLDDLTGQGLSAADIGSVEEKADFYVVLD